MIGGSGGFNKLANDWDRVTQGLGHSRFYPHDPPSGV